jgi:hypothetical protein
MGIALNAAPAHSIGEHVPENRVGIAFALPALVEMPQIA